MFYKSRGTQTEIDKILDDPFIANKTYILIEEDILSSVHASVSSESWRKMARLAKVIKYKGRESLLKKINEICDEIDKLRRECYVKALRSSRRA